MVDMNEQRLGVDFGRVINVWIVSKCGERIQRRTLRWLDHHDVYERTGLPRGNVRFCRQRAEKASHCRELGITHFIDDRADVLSHLRGLVPNLYLFGAQTRPIPGWGHPRTDLGRGQSGISRNTAGTDGVSHTPFALRRKSCPASYIAPARTVRMTGLPRRAPTRRAVSTSGER